MPLIDLTIRHGRTLDEARRGLERAVNEVTGRCRAVLRRVEWTADGNRVTLEGLGFSIEMWVDAEAVHATGNVLILGQLLGGQLGSGLQHVLEQALRKSLRP
jgi:hypothetical protein